MYLLSHPFKNSKPDLNYRVTFFIYSCIFVTLSILFFQPKHFYFWGEPPAWIWGGLRSIRSQKPTGLLSSVLYLMFFKMVSMATEVWRVSDGSQKTGADCKSSRLWAQTEHFSHQMDSVVPGCSTWIQQLDRDDLNWAQKKKEIQTFSCFYHLPVVKFSL